MLLACVPGPRPRCAGGACTRAACAPPGPSPAGSSCCRRSGSSCGEPVGSAGPAASPPAAAPPSWVPWERGAGRRAGARGCRQKTVRQGARRGTARHGDLQEADKQASAAGMTPTGMALGLVQGRERGARGRTPRGTTCVRPVAVVARWTAQRLSRHWGNSSVQQGCVPLTSLALSRGASRVAHGQEGQQARPCSPVWHGAEAEILARPKTLAVGSGSCSFELQLGCSSISIQAIFVNNYNFRGSRFPQ